MNADAKIEDFYDAPLPAQEDDPQSAIARLQEVARLRSRADEPPPKPGGRYAHQEAVASIMQRYDRLFLLHEAGTGKTCSVGGVAEIFKDHFLAFRKEPRHLALDQMPIKRAYILVRGKDLAKQFGREIACICRPGIYLTDREQQALKPDQQTHHLTLALSQWYEITTYKKFYNTYGHLPPEKLKEQFSGTLMYVDEIHNLTFAPTQKMPPPDSAPETIESYRRGRGKASKEGAADAESESEAAESESEAAVSESESENESETESERTGASGERKQKRGGATSVRNFEIYNFLWRLFHTIERSKVIVGSATPMSNSPTEIVPVINLVTPVELALPYFFPGGDVLDAETPFRLSDENEAATMLERFERAVTGRVSYVRALDTGAIPTYLGEPLSSSEGGETQTKVLTSMMSEEQTRVYNYVARAALPAETERHELEYSDAEKADSLFLKQRQTSTFVYPPSSFAKSLEEQVVPETSKSAVKMDPRWATPLIAGKKPHRFLHKPTPEFTAAVRKQPDVCSAKFNAIWDSCLEMEGCRFIYADWVYGAGAVTLGVYLMARGATPVYLTSEDTSFFEVPTSQLKQKQMKTQAAGTSRGLCDNSAPGILSRAYHDLPKGTFSFAIITSGARDAERDAILELFRWERNRNGKYLKVLIGSRQLGEGINLRHVLAMDVVNPTFDLREIYQAVRRVLRATSHVDVLAARARSAAEAAALLPRLHARDEDLLPAAAMLAPLLTGETPKLGGGFNILKAFQGTALRSAYLHLVFGAKNNSAALSGLIERLGFAADEQGFLRLLAWMGVWRALDRVDLDFEQYLSEAEGAKRKSAARARDVRVLLSEAEKASGTAGILLSEAVAALSGSAQQQQLLNLAALVAEGADEKDKDVDLKKAAEILSLLDREQGAKPQPDPSQALVSRFLFLLASRRFVVRSPEVLETEAGVSPKELMGARRFVVRSPEDLETEAGVSPKEFMGALRAAASEKDPLKRRAMLKKEARVKVRIALRAAMPAPGVLANEVTAAMSRVKAKAGNTGELVEKIADQLGFARLFGPEGAAEYIEDLVKAVSIPDAAEAKRAVAALADAIGEKGSGSNVDMSIYNRAEIKDRHIKRVMRVMKENAIDCFVNHARNVLPTDVDNSPECDYMPCGYRCRVVAVKGTVLTPLGKSGLAASVASLLKQRLVRGGVMTLEELQRAQTRAPTPQQLLTAAAEVTARKATVVDVLGFEQRLHMKGKLFYLAGDGDHGSHSDPGALAKLYAQETFLTKLVPLERVVLKLGTSLERKKLETYLNGTSVDEFLKMDSADVLIQLFEYVAAHFWWSEGKFDPNIRAPLFRACRRMVFKMNVPAARHKRSAKLEPSNHPVDEFPPTFSPDAPAIYVHILAYLNLPSLDPQFENYTPVTDFYRANVGYDLRVWDRRQVTGDDPMTGWRNAIPKGSTDFKTLKDYNFVVRWYLQWKYMGQLRAREVYGLLVPQFSGKAPIFLWANGFDKGKGKKQPRGRRCKSAAMMEDILRCLYLTHTRLVPLPIAVLTAHSKKFADHFARLGAAERAAWWTISPEDEEERRRVVRSWDADLDADGYLPDDFDLGAPNFDENVLPPPGPVPYSSKRVSLNKDLRAEYATSLHPVFGRGTPETFSDAELEFYHWLYASDIRSHCDLLQDFLKDLGLMCRIFDAGETLGVTDREPLSQQSPTPSFTEDASQLGDGNTTEDEEGGATRSESGEGEEEDDWGGEGR